MEAVPLSRLTLIVPTYNRPMYFRPQVEFWAEYPCSVIVIDGSTSGPQIDLELPPNISYFHSTLGFANRVKLAASQVRTEFVALLGDDEVHMPASLGKCVEFLDERADYSGCIGRPLAFSIDKSGHIVFQPIYDWFDGKNISDDSASSRLFSHFGNYKPIATYSVIRSNHFNFAIEYLGLEKDSAFGQDELVFEALVMLQGKFRVLDEIHWMRSHVPTFSDRSSEPNFDSARSFAEFWHSEEHLDWRFRFVTNLSEAANAVVSSTEPCRARTLDSVFDLYSDQFRVLPLRGSERLKQWCKRRGGRLAVLLSGLKMRLAQAPGGEGPAWNPVELVSVLSARNISIDHAEFDKFLEHVRRMHASQ